MRHLQLASLVLTPSTLDKAEPDAPNGIVHVQVAVLYRDADGNMYADPAGARDLEVRDAAIGLAARALMRAVAAKLADAADLPVRDKADPDAPMTAPGAR